METRIQAIARLAVSIYAFLLFSESFRRRREIERFLQVSIVYAGFCLWNFMLFLYYDLQSAEAVYLASLWGFVSVSLTSFGVFCFSCRLAFGRKADRWMLFFAIVPAITAVLSITAPLQRLFVAGHRDFVYLPLRELVIVRGPWFLVHSIWSYLLSVLSVVLLLIRSASPHVKNRGATILLAASFVVFFVVVFLSNFTPLKGAVQPYALLAHLAFITVLYCATFLDSDDTVVYFGKRLFYEAIDMPVLLFNDRNELLDLNGEAARYFASLSVSVDKYTSYERLLGGGAFSRIDIAPEEAEDSSFFLQNAANGQIIYFNRCDVADGKDRRIGFSLTLYNLRTMDALVQGLQKRAYSDSLCQCLNRTCYELRRREILESAPRPLALIVADVDDLKSVNDRFGHKAGDEYLTVCVRLLKKVTRSVDTLFRIGGDEFALFLPGTDQPGVERIRTALASEFAALKLDYPANLSIGYSIIRAGDTDFDRHFAAADAEMYRKKQGEKG